MLLRISYAHVFASTLFALRKKTINVSFSWIEEASCGGEKLLAILALFLGYNIHAVRTSNSYRHGSGVLAHPLSYHILYPNYTINPLWKPVYDMKGV
jgi:hypothetical protein